MAFLQLALGTERPTSPRIAALQSRRGQTAEKTQYARAQARSDGQLLFAVRPFSAPGGQDVECAQLSAAAAFALTDVLS